MYKFNKMQTPLTSFKLRIWAVPLVPFLIDQLTVLTTTVYLRCLFSSEELPVDFLNTLEPFGVPPHRFYLKAGVPEIDFGNYVSGSCSGKV